MRSDLALIPSHVFYTIGMISAHHLWQILALFTNISLLVFSNTWQHHTFLPPLKVRYYLYFIYAPTFCTVLGKEKLVNKWVIEQLNKRIKKSNNRPSTCLQLPSDLSECRNGREIGLCFKRPLVSFLTFKEKKCFLTIYLVTQRAFY